MYPMAREEKLARSSCVGDRQARVLDYRVSPLHRYSHDVLRERQRELSATGWDKRRASPELRS